MFPQLPRQVVAVVGVGGADELTPEDLAELPDDWLVEAGIVAPPPDGDDEDDR